MRRVALAVFTAAVAGIAALQAQLPPLLTEADLHCIGAFNTVQLNQGPLTTIEPITMRTVNGEDRYITFDGKGYVAEMRAPVQLSPCNVNPQEAVEAQLVQDWGLFPPVHNSVNGVPGANAAYAFGVSYAVDSNWLLLHWTPTYSGINTTGVNAMAGAVMDDATKTLKIAGCWGVSNVASPRIATGVIDVPNELKAALPANTWKLIGQGGAPASVQLGLSLGPYLQAIPKPTGNACPDGIDTPVTGGPVLASFPGNSVGPTNYNSGSMGQTPTVAPTVPYPAWMAYANYSSVKYAEDWEPWVENGAKHGWFTTDTMFRLDNYDDGLRRGLFLVYAQTSGWMNTRVLASPTPTLDTTTYYPTLTFAVADLSTHDGHSLQVGDMIIVQTCTIGVDLGCDSTANGRNFSNVVVDSVTPSTALVVGHVISPDFANHYLPVAGAPVYAGSTYIHGSPQPSRFTGPTAQIYDARQLQEVVNKTREPYNVRYVGEFDLSKLISGFGCPGCAVPGVASGSHYGPIAVMANPAKHQIVVVMAHGKSLIGVFQHTVYLLQVGGDAPTPPPVPPLTITCPAGPVVASPTGSSVPVTYLPATTAGGTPPVTVAYTSPGSSQPVTSGSLFPVGDTTVVATATDVGSPAQSVGCQFVVRVTYTPPTPGPTPDTTPPAIREFSVTPQGAQQYAIHVLAPDNVKTTRIDIRVNTTIRKTCTLVDACDLRTKLPGNNNMVRVEARDAAGNVAARDQTVTR